MAQRLVCGGHEVGGFDPDATACSAARSWGAESVSSLAELVAWLPAPRVLWLMVPAGAITEATLQTLRPLLAAGDVVIDGGNAYYQDTVRRAGEFAEQGIDYLDCGTSGGIWGLIEGYSLMIGGSAPVIAQLAPVFETLAPARDKGWGRVGPAGAGHFTKMIHNGIEYGLMQAYAEGFSILQHKSEFALDLHQIAEIWRHGSVVRSWLLELTSAALAANPAMTGVAARVDDSGEGRWTVAEAIALDVSAPVITLALLERLRSRDADAYADKLLACMRQQFGGHAVTSS